MSLSVFAPKTLRREEIANFLFLSIFTYKAPSDSDSISIQEPRAGIIFAPNKFLPFDSFNVKNIPYDLANWGITTLSIPLIMKVP